MTPMSTFTCNTCFDTHTIDQDGAEILCPDCTRVRVKITGLSHGAGEHGVNYDTAGWWTSSTITFVAPTRGHILADVARVRAAAVREALRLGLRGRNHASSWAIAIEKRVQAAKAEIVEVTA